MSLVKPKMKFLDEMEANMMKNVEEPALGIKHKSTAVQQQNILLEDTLQMQK